MVQDTVATEVQTDWILREHLLHALNSALAFREVDQNLGGFDAILDLDELFRVVELRKVLKRFVFLLDNDRGGKHESEVNFLLENASHVIYFLQLGLILL